MAANISINFNYLDNSYSKFHFVYQALLKIYIITKSTRNQFNDRILMSLRDADWNEMLSLQLLNIGFSIENKVERKM